ncbi:nuclear transport factor 2 family protein [Noviherbaspirillum galbum]|uniref:Nuclear transport factor 2 family protein n=1 Tax=Noviherbaspirillum galbum TaxID=2709383 RepID=A0A6B3SYP7_9BURK|nr:nuclear transport factor 2 family protein [Noviherbaspirillum galbum]NEX63942.1 nuclear transport factor 2 family protein [Noviherbaspirillum galbum]
MNPQEVQTAANRFIEELHRLEDGDEASADRLAAMFAPDAELTNPILQQDGGSRKGHDAIADFWHQYSATFGDIHSDFFDVVAGDHTAGLFWRSSGTTATGQPLQYDGVSHLELNDEGKIARFQGFFDTRQMTFKTGAH